MNDKGYFRFSAFDMSERGWTHNIEKDSAHTKCVISETVVDRRD